MRRDETWRTNGKTRTAEKSNGGMGIVAGLSRTSGDWVNKSPAAAVTSVRRGMIETLIFGLFAYFTAL